MDDIHFILCNNKSKKRQKLSSRVRMRRPYPKLLITSFGILLVVFQRSSFQVEIGTF